MIRLRMELLYDKNVITINKILLSILGLWPEKHNDIPFFFVTVYFSGFMLVLFVALTQDRRDIETFMRSFSFTFPELVILLKTLIFRWNISELLPILAEVKQNVKDGLYNDLDEKQRLVWYGVASTLFIVLSVSWLWPVPTLHYLMPILHCIGSSTLDYGNCSLPYDLPVRVHPIYEVTDVNSYLLICVILVPCSTLLVVGSIAPVSLFVTLAFYLCGQLSILGSRINNIDTSSSKYGHNMKILMERHIELLRLSKILADTYSTLMFVQLLGLIGATCIVIFQLLTTLESGKGLNEIIQFILYSGVIMLIMFFYCFVGECLLNENASLDWACYCTNWYGLPVDSIRVLMICTMRSRKPLYLTAGKFYFFSLETFGTVMKTSMAYLSVLRTIT